LVVKNAAAHHAISAKFPKPIDNKGKPLVVQYEVKLQGAYRETSDESTIAIADCVCSFCLDMLNCGGAYMKLLRENKALHAEEFSNTTPYVIMFGPDRCGVTNKVRQTV
jgi:calnexin